MQVTSFVSPRAVPQLADAEAVLAGIDRPEGAWSPRSCPTCAAPSGRRLRARRGAHGRLGLRDPQPQEREPAHRAVPEGVRGGLRHAERAGIAVEGGIATAFGCPFEGVVPPEQVARIARRYQELGADSGVAWGHHRHGHAAHGPRRDPAIRAEAPGLGIGICISTTRAAWALPA
jgi:hydroxymethylglutaryl-CoA lyase